MKFKGKGEMPNTDELVRLKDEEIASLVMQLDNLMKV
jgi:hypothetical protein